MMDPTPTKQQRASATAAKALPLELVEEVLLRFPPDDPASLAHAALVSKRWCRLVCGRGFRRRFREFHGAPPPLLGFVCPARDHRTAPEDRLFVPRSASSFKPPRGHHHGGDDPRFDCMEAVHSCHGRVLLRSSPGPAVPAPEEEDLFVWDPVADDLRKLPRWPLYSPYSCDEGNAAVLCAGTLAADGGGCDHLDCHRGPFMVVFVGPDRNDRAFLCVYSSEAGTWSDPVYVAQRHCYYDKGNSVLIGSAVYFKMSPDVPAILKYDLLTREPSWIRVPLRGVLQKDFHMRATLLVMEGGRLGFAFTDFTPEMPNRLLLWSMEHCPGEDARWAQRVVDLDKLLETQLGSRTNVVGFADTGAGGVIFIRSSNGDKLFSLNLSSWSTKVVREGFGYRRAIPFMSFCTPALGAVSTEEGPGASEPSV